MAIQARRWTLDEVHALPDDGNKYELIHGDLLVTPAPTPRHEGIATRLREMITRFVAEQRLGIVYGPRAVIRIGRVVEVEPDLHVRAPIDERVDWEHQPLPILVVEVLSRGTRHTDLTRKRDVYLAAGIMEYWTIDPDARALTVHRPERESRALTDEVHWRPPGTSSPLRIHVPSLFR
jgi:Uma2 family endonuclease